ncbi:MAG TPA: tetratricopeptide repeat protein, partial [Candidatus Manganitrophaceae bacterium]|nr:tetratricopeptide repeat protein [Candidatus Manganitrophaceae bacterium]
RIQEGFGNLNGMAHAEGTLGTFYQTKGDLEEAVRHLEKARELFQKAGASQQIHIVDLKIQMLHDQMSN